MKLIRKIFGKRKSFNDLINIRRSSGLSPFQPTNANLPSRDFSTIAFSRPSFIVFITKCMVLCLHLITALTFLRWGQFSMLFLNLWRD